MVFRLFVLAMFFAFALILNAQNPDFLFKLYDGYFQEKNNEPVHLTHETINLYAQLGNEYYLWLDFIVDTTNPCSRREKEPCRLIQQVVHRTDNKETFVTGWTKGLEFRVDGNIGFSLTGTLIPRSAPTENTFLVVKIVKQDKEFFRQEWLLDIR